MTPASPSPRSGECTACGLRVCLHFDDANRFVGCAGAREQLFQLTARVSERGPSVSDDAHRPVNRRFQIVR